MAVLATTGGAAADEPSARALVSESRAAMRNDPERSRLLAEQALALLARQPDADLQVLAEVQLCDYYGERDRPIAERHLAAAQALLPRTTRPALAAMLLGCDGELRELAGDTAQAMTLYDRAVATAEAAHDDDVLANALYQRGYLRGVRGELASGLMDLRRASDLFDRLHQTEEGLNTLLAVALLYDRMGDHEQARRYFENALEAQRSSGLVREQAVTQHNLGRALEHLGDWASARASFDTALSLSQKLAYPRGEAYALRGLASVSNAEGDGDAALRYAQQAATLLDRAPDERLRAQIALQRGVALRLLHRAPESVAVLTDALKVFDRADSRAESTTARGELAASYAALGDYKAAYEQERAFKAASNELLKRQIEERFATLRVEFETTVTDRENQALKRENAASERALAQEQLANRLRTVSLVLAGILVAVLSVLVVRHRRASSRMHGLAMTDELTQLRNRRHVLATLQQLVASGMPGGLFIADLDLFKAINDTHGHLVGDEILRAVAAALRDALPADSELGRLGGEEFVVILPAADRLHALRLAEEARRAVAALDATRWLRDRGVTISIGATAYMHQDDLGAILRRADEALYEAKRSGRNCVRWMPREAETVAIDLTAPAAEPGPAPDLPAQAAWQGTRP
ncbi:MAG: diguanylate cyclase [Proteobacteria bacterium]|nr:diguanylate cyclase [Pseudomonadota bacterium]